VVAGSNAYATTYTWDGGGDGSTWTNGKNWGLPGTGSGHPSTGDTANIPTGAPILGANRTIATLNISGTGTLNLGGNTLTITSDYLNSFFGLGNSFNRYANITRTTGVINAAG